MKILGIDPGTAITGWAVIEAGSGQPKSVAFGSIQPESIDLPERLKTIHLELKQLISMYKPDAISIEELFFATNAKTAISVGQARGVILLTASLSGIPVASYTPLAVKQTVCGDGKADKKQVGKMVALTLRLRSVPQPDDTADALAIALTHAFRYKMSALTL
jgi:crossover junction endodeoxyribonuclease RuvC